MTMKSATALVYILPVSAVLMAGILVWTCLPGHDLARDLALVRALGLGEPTLIPSGLGPGKRNYRRTGVDPRFVPELPAGGPGDMVCDVFDTSRPSLRPW